MEKRYSYFSHKNCEFFPCHAGADREDFNCLFCYCPLYALGEKCGGNYQYLSNGIKDCSNCLFPHLHQNYDAVTQRFQEIVDMMSHNSTISYYEDHADAFAANTKDVDFYDTQERFLRWLPDGGKILDFGCGAGRDTKFFLQKGYEVEALDGSWKLCKIAEKNTGIKVTYQRFETFQKEECYDGIWACASVLHLPAEQLQMVLKNLAAALKKEGVLYLSFKYGTEETIRNGRFFTDMTEEMFASVLQQGLELTLEEEWVSADVRPGREKEQWLNLILKKEEEKK